MGKLARRRRRTVRKREEGIKNANEIAAVGGSPNGTELRRNTRRTLACYHSKLCDKDDFLKHDEVRKQRRP